MINIYANQFQEQIESLIRYIQPKCAIKDLAYCIGDLSTIQSKFERANESKILFFILWAGKVYAYFYHKMESLTCPFCLLQSIKRNLSSGPDYLSIISPKTSRSKTFAMPPNALINLLLASYEHINQHALFQNGHTVLVYTLNNQVMTIEPLINDPSCERCHTLFETNIIRFNDREILSSHNAIRYYSIEYYQQTMQDFCGQSLGLVNQIANDLQLPVASCTAKLIYDKDKHEMTLGRANQFNHSKTIAVIEALERFAGLNHSYRNDMVFNSFSQLEGAALDPRQFCLHSPTQYAFESFPFLSFHPDLQLPWVKGLDLITNKEVWVCASAVFYGSKHSRQYPMLAFESSNGCAVGATYDEAILSGIFELVERDAFLYAWYARASLPDITDRVLNSPELEMIYARFKLFSGVSVHFYDASSEHEIPCVFALAIGHKKEKPKFAAAGGSGINYYDAAKSALYELSCHYIRLQYLLSQPGEIARANTMLQDSFKVIKMEDHGLVNSLAEASPRFEFLMEQKKNFSFKGSEVLNTDNPKQTLEQIIKRLANIGLRVVAVDQTPLAMRKKHLVCVKIFISDMLPITFGHIYSRLETQKLGPNSNFLDVYPHPFP